ncbi:MAG: SDR family NAD(P)-dependent oxidoreductase [Patescibacteria group bacterium]
MSQSILLLVGPGKHFGKEIAQRFARENFCIVLLSKTGASAKSIAEEIQKNGGDAIGETCDVTNERQCKEVVGRLVRKSEGKIACVIFNAKESPKGKGTELSCDLFMEALAVNTGGALSILQAVLPYTEKDASFIATGGGYKDIPDPAKCALSVSKGALHTLVLALVDPCIEHAIHAKTLIIDGAVRNEGPLTPGAVAEKFWEAHLSQETVVTMKP